MTCHGRFGCKGGCTWRSTEALDLRGTGSLEVGLGLGVHLG